MAKLLKLRRGTTTQHASFTGAEGEVTIDTTKDTAVVHDGSQAGGRPLAREDMSNVPAGTILGTQLENSGVTAGAYGSSSAIPIVTVDAQGLVTAASTTAIDSTTIANGSASVAVSNNGPITSNANHDFSAGIDVTGNITGSGNVDIDGQIQVGSVNTYLKQNQLRSNAPGSMFFDHGTTGQDIVFRTSNSSALDTPGITIKANGNVDFANGIDVTGNITVTGTVDGVDVATRDTLFGGLTSSSGVLTNGVTATTQSASDNSTKVATTAYVTTGIANAQAFPSGTKMLFQQTAAPTGWTKVTSGVDNKALRVVSGTAGSGGSNAFSNTLADRSITANAGNTTATGNISVANQTQTGNVSVSIANATTGGTVSNHTLTTSEMPSHSHGLTSGNYGQSVYRPAVGYYRNSGITGNTNSTGGGGAHSHGFTGGSHTHNANATFSGDTHNHNATFTGAAHNHSISVTNLDLAVSYLDVIIAAKD